MIVEGERLLIDIDFRSEFEVARSTRTYEAILQSLPYIFVGKSDRIGQIVSIVSEAAKQSLKKKGMHIPPWRKAEYMRSKWLSPYSRAKQTPSTSSTNDDVSESKASKENNGDDSAAAMESDCGELELIFGEEETLPPSEADSSEEKVKPIVAAPPWQLPAIKPKSVERGKKVVTGLASLLKEKP